MVFVGRYRHQLLLLLFFLLAEIVVNPLGEFPLNDDCTYTKATLEMAEKGTINIGEWPAMTLLTNMALGALLIKVFGFSFFILRLSTLLSAACGVLLMFATIKRLAVSPGVAFLAALTLLFNPFFFNLSNTFMTDTNFTVLLLAGLYCAVRFFTEGDPRWLPLFLISSLALVMLRQYGLILPLCFTVCAFIKIPGRKWGIIWALLTVFICFVSLYVYERHLAQVLAPEASYKFIFSGQGQEKSYLRDLAENAHNRIPVIMVQLFMYTIPCALLLLFSAVHTQGWRLTLAVLTVSLVAYKYFLAQAAPLISNLVTNMSVGPDTFYESLSAYYTQIPDHTSLDGFNEATNVVKAVCSVFSGAALIASLIIIGRKLRNRPQSAAYSLVILLSLSYVFLVLATPTHFDRHQLPLIALCIILFASQTYTRLHWLPICAVAGLAVISIAGTKDYFSVSRIRWQAYNHLKSQGVPASSIHAGFETSCWDAQKYRYIFGSDQLEQQQYLIQYTRLPGFQAVKAYPFRGYFPPRKDTIFIFRRE